MYPWSLCSSLKYIHDSYYKFSGILHAKGEIKEEKQDLALTKNTPSISSIFFPLVIWSFLFLTKTALKTILLLFKGTIGAHTSAQNLTEFNYWRISVIAYLQAESTLSWRQLLCEKADYYTLNSHCKNVASTHRV